MDDDVVGSQVDSIPPTLCPTANKIRFRTFGMNTLRNLADTCMFPAEILTDIAILELVSFPSSFFFFPSEKRYKRDYKELHEILRYTSFYNILSCICNSYIVPFVAESRQLARTRRRPGEHPLQLTRINTALLSL